MIDLTRLMTLRRAPTRRQRSGGRIPGRGQTARVVCIASGKGGTGKSVLATNVASVRAEQGERVLLVDFDAGLANAHLLLGLAPRYDLGHVMDGRVPVHAAVVAGRGKLSLLSGGVGREALASPTRRQLDRLFRALRPLEDSHDLILVDHGAGLGYGMVAHLAATSTLLLVTGHEVTALSDAYALFKRAVSVNASIRVGLLVNRSPDEPTALSAWDRFRFASNKFLGRAPEFVGWVPADDAVSRSIEERRPVTLNEPESEAGRAIRRVSEWAALDLARTSSAFYERARRALR